METKLAHDKVQQTTLLDKLVEFEPRFGDAYIESLKGADRELFEACKITRETLGIWFSIIEPMDGLGKACLFCMLVKIGLSLDEALDLMSSQRRVQLENPEMSPVQDQKISLMLFEGNILEATKQFLKVYGSQKTSKRLLKSINNESLACMLQYNGYLTEFDFGGKKWTYHCRIN